MKRASIRFLPVLVLLGNASIVWGAAETAVPCLPEPQETPLSYGQIAECQINPVGDVDLFTFQGTAGEIVSILPIAIVGVNNVAVGIELRSPSGGLLASGGRIEFTLTVSGTHRIRASEYYGVAATYRLSLERRRPASPSARVLSYGALVTDDIAPVGDVDFFTFNGTAGTTISLVPLTLAGVNNVAVGIELYDPDGLFLRSGGRIDIALTKAGTFFVRASEYYGVVATYSLDLQCLSGGCTDQAQPPATGRRFVPATPCRLVDTREASLGAFGKPALVANAARSFAIPQRCGLPSNAAAYSLNVTVVPQGRLGYVTIWPTGAAQPFVSTLNSIDGRIKANAALVPAGTAGAINVFATNPTELVLDINGYFIDPAVNAQALAFYPLTPCRIADTRNANGALGGPVIAAGAGRDFPVLASNCGVPANAQAYSLNATVVPSGPLGYLTLWPTGQAQPFVSTLNAPTGAVVANAAIVPAGTNGSISAFVTSASHLVLDINGYFGPPGAANGQRFFTATPCRLLDTREANGEFGGTVLAASQSRSYRLPLAGCALPGTAAAFSLNATVVPAAMLGYLTLWPTGSAQPFVSTLNAIDDSVVANAAIVPAGTAGAVSSFVTNQTHLILDTNGYFAP